MSPLTHRVYVFTLVSIVVLTTIFLFYKGMPYYSTSIEERFYHPDHANFKPSGLFGHGLGIVGTLLILIGVSGYIARKRSKFLSRFGRLKYWLEFHIFLCALGPIMVLFHTAFKFGGIVSIAFWSMVAVVLSGVIGRFIYIQIPRTIEGRELSLNEVKGLKSNVSEILRNSFLIDQESFNAIIESTSITNETGGSKSNRGFISKFFADRKSIRNVKKTLKQNALPHNDVKKIVEMVKDEMALNNKISRLLTMQKLFRYWHVAHLPFALIMLIIVVIHIGVTLAFGYKWIF